MIAFQSQQYNFIVESDESKSSSDSESTSSKSDALASENKAPPLNIVWKKLK